LKGFVPVLEGELHACCGALPSHGVVIGIGGFGVREDPETGGHGVQEFIRVDLLAG
jgi:hypothetical protein